MSKKKIVIVEDDADILFTVSIILRDAGYEVTSLTSAAGVAEATHELPDLYILDKRMPDADGLDLCRHLRNKAETKDIPVIIISASPKFGSPAMKAGASAFLAKPFQMAKLLDLVDKHTTSDRRGGNNTNQNPDK
jgi:DNA-binding response OmpR family regulator